MKKAVRKKFYISCHDYGADAVAGTCSRITGYAV